MDEVPDQVQPDLPTDPFKEASRKHRPEARSVEEGLPAVVLGAIAGDSLQGKVSTAGFKSYLDKLLEDSGSPTDPIERQFVEQLAWAHARIGSLHVQAAHAQSPEQAAALNNAATKLMNEHRKTGLALREYRSPVVPKQVTVVRQQNVAAGNQNVAMIDGRPSGGRQKRTRTANIGSNQDC